MTARPRKATTVKPSFAALLADARLPERSVPVCMRADLVADHEAADRELEKLTNQPSTKFSGNGSGELRQKILDLEEQMRAATYEFRLRALPKPRFRALVAEHQPRRTADGSVDDRDRALGVNAETFFDALIRASLLDPELSGKQWTELAEALTDRQYDVLADAAWYLNRGDVDVPFSRAASRLNPSSDSE